MFRGCFSGSAKQPRVSRETYGDRSEGEYACPSFAGEARIPFRDLCETFRSGLLDEPPADASGKPLLTPPHPDSSAPRSADTFDDLKHGNDYDGNGDGHIPARALPTGPCPTRQDTATPDKLDTATQFSRVRFESTPEEAGDAADSRTKPDADDADPVVLHPKADIENAPRGEGPPALKLQSSSGPRTLRSLNAGRVMRSSRASRTSSFDPRASTGSGWNECGALDDPCDPSELARTMTGLMRESWSSESSAGSGRGSGRILSSRGEACGDVVTAHTALALDGQPAWTPRTFGRKLSRKLSFLVTRQKGRTAPTAGDGSSAGITKADLAVRS